MKTQIQIFTGNEIMQIIDKANIWLYEHEELNIVDVKYSRVASDDFYSIHIVIIYKID